MMSSLTNTRETPPQIPLWSFWKKTFEPAVRAAEGEIYPAGHIEQWADLWENNRFVALVAARGFLKSMFCKAVVAHALYSHTAGAFDAFYFSAKRDLAREHLRKLKMYLAPIAESLGWQDVTEGEALLRYRRGRAYFSCEPEGIDAASRGRRANLLVIDDPVDPRKPGSYAEINRAVSAIKRRIVPLMKDARARIIFAGTPIIEGDVTDWIQGNKEFALVRLPAIARPDGSEFQPGTPLDVVFSGGVPTWPERYPVAELLRLRNVMRDEGGTDYSFGAEYLLWPVGASDTFIPATVLSEATSHHEVPRSRLALELD